ncbi:protein FAR1-RELATED SEQUENCE 5-like [Lotus japonicus]|uniref:protein FAR1-RELATED SEQUENCE 5-like n=1 Tax=Lotus japonicus TaxID=34305 RepID=UPI002584906B|nr:protein FAR1-RELATED SEQUENCE 5-like [Lotus japonicus]
MIGEVGSVALNDENNMEHDHLQHGMQMNADENEQPETNGVEGEPRSQVRKMISIDGIQDMGNVNFKILSSTEVKDYDFLDRDVAFTFYNLYARMNGFSARRGKVCHKQGHKVDKFGDLRTRKREPKRDIRCFCKAECRVHMDYDTGRWYVKSFADEHSHLLYMDKHAGLLARHRRMNDADVTQLKDMRRVGISTRHVLASLASQKGGYENVGHTMQDMFNELDKQRRNELPDARGALSYLRSLKTTDSDMYWRHIANENGRLQHLFWADGHSQKDYKLFGDVIAFDATYRRNKYFCPLVVFCGVNHHNRTIIFGAAIVSNEKEETYVWVLNQFLDAMKGKMPLSVITNGDKAMKNAIRRVFPTAHHRLCGWHLIQNATSNVSNPRFTALFKNCMLGDHDIAEFEALWEEMVVECGVQDNEWVKETYEKRSMWATAHMRGHFFAGFRTTSRVEGLHAQVGRYVNFRNNLRDFLENFSRCCSYFRFKEIDDDFKSIHGKQVLLTYLKRLEKSASEIYTRQIFFMFRKLLERASTFRVRGYKKTTMCHIYFVFMYRRKEKEWHVTFCPSTEEFKCSCLRMESVGIPCDHIVAVLVELDKVDLPESLISARWTKHVKDSLPCNGDSNVWDPMTVCRNVALNENCRQMNKLACRNFMDYEETNVVIMAQKKRLEQRAAAAAQSLGEGVLVGEDKDSHLQNPLVVRTKGCGNKSNQAGQKQKRSIRCGNCGVQGHNRKTCPNREQHKVLTQDTNAGPSQIMEEDNSMRE